MRMLFVIFLARERERERKGEWGGGREYGELGINCFGRGSLGMR